MVALKGKWRYSWKTVTFVLQVSIPLTRKHSPGKKDRFASEFNLGTFSIAWNTLVELLSTGKNTICF